MLIKMSNTMKFHSFKISFRINCVRKEIQLNEFTQLQLFLHDFYFLKNEYF